MDEAPRELDAYARVNVSLLDEDIPVLEVVVKLKSAGQVSAGELFRRLADELGLQPSSWRYFSLVEGLVAPVRRLRESDEVSLPAPELSLQKWVFDPTTEKALLSDPVATHLLYTQARHQLNSGSVHVTEDDTRRLEDCLQPGFVAEAQYVCMCHKIPGYDSVVVPMCTTCAALPMLGIAANAHFSMYISRKGIQVHFASTKLFAHWSKVKSWSREHRGNAMNFDLVAHNDTTCRLQFSCPQVLYLHAVVMEVVHSVSIKKKTDIVYHTDMVKKSGTWSEWENVLFSSHSKVPLEDIPCGHTEITALVS